MFRALAPLPGARLPRTATAPATVEKLGPPGAFRRGGLVVLRAAEVGAAGAAVEPEAISLLNPYLRARVYPALGGRIGELVAASDGRDVLRFEARLVPGEGTLDLGGALDDFDDGASLAAIPTARFRARRAGRTSRAARVVLAHRDRKERRRLVREVELLADAPVALVRFAVGVLPRPARPPGGFGSRAGRPGPAYAPQIALAPGDDEEPGLDLVVPTATGVERWAHVADGPVHVPVRPCETRVFRGLTAGYVAATAVSGATTVLVLPERPRGAVGNVEALSYPSRLDLYPFFRARRARPGAPARHAWALATGERALLDARGFVVAARDATGRRLALVARRAGTTRASLVVRVEVDGAARDVVLARREVEGLGPLFVGRLGIGPSERFSLI